ncbi:HpsJ-like protein, cyanoexosortase A-associated [Almyronema epifaneia]|uniref:HpsJ family protein n=1 Tax=Almyronema epifaneia S1 TaxID=2991925 RepID=A0ABW6IFA4_9CYAN
MVNTNSRTHDSRKTFALVRSSGYGLLFIFALQLADTFIPAYFMDPDWELSMVANLVERMPLALIALVLIFFGEMSLRKKWEKPLLRGLSWSTLIVGLLFLSLIPLSVSASIKLKTQTSAEVNFEYRQQINQLEQLKTRVNSATSQEMNALAAALATQNSTVEVSDNQTLEEQVLAEIDLAKQQIQAQRDEAELNQWRNLQKNAVRWSLSALISAFLFFSVWNLTVWAR